MSKLMSIHLCKANAKITWKEAAKDAEIQLKAAKARVAELEAVVRKCWGRADGSRGRQNGYRVAQCKSIAHLHLRHCRRHNLFPAQLSTRSRAAPL